VAEGKTPEIIRRTKLVGSVGQEGDTDFLN